MVAERCLGTPVTAVRELPAPATTSYALRRLLLDLADGRRLDVLLKHFDVSPHAAEFALGRGARERYVYETVLAGRDLGTPELYGVVWDEPSGRHWLLLEFLQGRTLRQAPLEDWIAAAGWLGRLTEPSRAGRPSSRGRASCSTTTAPTSAARPSGPCKQSACALAPSTGGWRPPWTGTRR
jgi:hypothetical protein